MNVNKIERLCIIITAHFTIILLFSFIVTYSMKLFRRKTIWKYLTFNKTLYIIYYEFIGRFEKRNDTYDLSRKCECSLTLIKWNESPARQRSQHQYLLACSPLIEIVRCIETPSVVSEWMDCRGRNAPNFSLGYNFPIRRVS